MDECEEEIIKRELTEILVKNDDAGTVSYREIEITLFVFYNILRRFLEY